jgi:hypothetical protein
VLERVGEAGLAAGQVMEYERAEQRPAQAGPVHDRGVDGAHGRDAALDERVRLAPQRGLEAVGQVPRELGAQPDRALADCGIEAHRALDRALVGPRAADDLDQRDEVGRVERVPDHDPLGVALAERLQRARRQAR